MARIFSLLFLVCVLFSSQAKQVDGAACGKHDLQVYQTMTGSNGELSQYNVKILNTGTQPASKVHVSCGDFSPSNFINPKIFRKLKLDDCLVKDGLSIASGVVVSFDYTSPVRYDFMISSSQCSSGKLIYLFWNEVSLSA